MRRGQTGGGKRCIRQRCSLFYSPFHRYRRGSRDRICCIILVIFLHRFGLSRRIGGEGRERRQNQYLFLLLLVRGLSGSGRRRVDDRQRGSEWWEIEREGRFLRLSCFPRIVARGL